MQLNHLYYFYTVARLNSFTLASKELRVSQPSISKILKQLEEAQGRRLMDRSRRSEMKLTESGEIFYKYCTKIFGEIDNLKQQIANQNKECVGALRIAASDNLCNYVLPELVAQFSRQHPKVEFSLFAGTSQNVKQELLSDRADLALFYTRPNEPQFKLRVLTQVKFAVVVSHQSPIRNITDLKAATYIGSRSTDYTKTYPALEMLNALKIKPSQTFECNSQETQKRLVSLGLGYSVMPEFMIRHHVNVARFRAIKTPTPIEAPLYLVKRLNRTLPNSAALFEESLTRATLDKLV